MKKVILILVLAGILYSCGHRHHSKLLDPRDTIRPGTIETKEGGWYMKAKIDGKEWYAISIMPPDSAGKIIGYYYSRDSIGLPYDKRNMVVGKKVMITESNPASFSRANDADWYIVKKGVVEITKVNENWAEGTFSFSASTSYSAKTLEITDGFFRISLAKTQ